MNTGIAEDKTLQLHSFQGLEFFFSYLDFSGLWYGLTKKHGPVLEVANHLHGGA